MTHHDGTTPAGASDLAATPVPPAIPLRATAGPEGSDTPAAGPADLAPASQPTASDEPPPTVDEVRAALRRVKDPELNLNIVDLGLVYEIGVDGRAVQVDMSLTSPGCPSGPEIMRDAEQAVKALPGVEATTVNLVWSPIWTPERIEPRVRSYLGF